MLHKIHPIRLCEHFSILVLPPGANRHKSPIASVRVGDSGASPASDNAWGGGSGMKGNLISHHTVKAPFRSLVRPPFPSTNNMCPCWLMGYTKHQSLCWLPPPPPIDASGTRKTNRLELSLFSRWSVVELKPDSWESISMCDACVRERADSRCILVVIVDSGWSVLVLMNAFSEVQTEWSDGSNTIWSEVWIAKVPFSEAKIETKPINSILNTRNCLLLLIAFQWDMGKLAPGRCGSHWADA